MRIDRRSADGLRVRKEWWFVASYHPAALATLLLPAEPRRGLRRTPGGDAYSINTVAAKKNADDSVVIQFAGCDGKIPNRLPIVSGWNYKVRLYRPRAETLSGTWTFPQAKPVS